MGEAIPVTCVGILPGGALCSEPTEYIVSDLPTCAGCVGNVVKASLRNCPDAMTVSLFRPPSEATPCPNPQCRQGHDHDTATSRSHPWSPFLSCCRGCKTCLGSGYVTVCGDCGGSGEASGADLLRGHLRCSGCGGSGVLPYPANNKDNKHNHK